LGIEHGLPRSWKYQKAFRDYIDALIVNSAAIRERWLQAAPWFPADEVHVVLNGVSPPALAVSSLRHELGIPDRVPVIAAAGWLERRKGFDVLLAALARVSHPEARLVIAGDGVDGPVLRALAADLGVAPRVHWLGFRRDLDNVLLGADLFVLPSRREGMANVMLEAMAARCLVIATGISGVPEALGAREGRPAAGWIVPREDPPAMALAIDAALAALASGQASHQLEETRWRVEHWFSPERTVLETERVLLRPAPGAD
jgi:glycosyltransferase involved in cell wall biosynthesis